MFSFETKALSGLLFIPKLMSRQSDGFMRYPPHLGDEFMTETLRYPSFAWSHARLLDWQAAKEFSYDRNMAFMEPEHLGHTVAFLYPGLIERFIDNVTVTPSGNEWLDPCWIWKGNASKLIAHKHMNMVQAKRVAYALCFPNQYHHHMERIRRKGGKLLRFSVYHRCSNEHCVRPDHLVPKDMPGNLTYNFYVGYLHTPRMRLPRKDDNDPDLTTPEVCYFRGLMRCGASDPVFQLQRLADRIGINTWSLFQRWERECTDWEKNYYSLLPIHLRPERLLSKTW